MKVVILGKYHEDELATDGALHHSIGLCRALENNYSDLELHIVTLGTNNFIKRIRRNTTLHVVSLHGFPFEHAISSVFVLIKKILEIDPTIIHSIGSTQPYALPALILAKKYGYKVVISPLGIAQREAIIKFNKPRYILHRIWFPWIERIVFRELPLITLTQSIQELVRQYTNQPIYVIPSAIDDHFFDIKRSNPIKNSILCVSVIEKRKGLLDLLQSVEILRYQIPTIKFIHLGKLTSKTYYRELEKYIRDNDLFENVHFFGEASQLELEDYLQKASVFVLPSYEESFGIAVVEAMAAGIPVVATRVNGLRDVVEDQMSGLLVAPNTPKELANAINRILTIPSLSEKLAAGGKIRAKKYTWDKIAKSIYNVYIDLITDECR